MRPTWIVLGLVVGLGAVAYVKLRERVPTPALNRAADSQAETESQPATPGMADPVPTPPSSGMADPAGMQGAGEPAVPVEPTAVAATEAERKAGEIRAQIDEKRRANDAAAADALEKKLDAEYGETAEAKRHALSRGQSDAASALKEDRPVTVRVPLADRARRDLSRATDLPEMFDPSGRPTDDRKRLLEKIASLNALVMTVPEGVPGVTTPYVVKAGDSPLRIVSQGKLPYGPNALLFWNQGGNLDPSRLQAGRTILLPVEPLELRVSLAHKRTGVYLGGVLVKEFEVGVGKAATPTYPGTYAVKDKYRNPDWHVPPQINLPGNPRVIPYKDPRNELGDAWIPISSPEHPTGYGIHGTNKPETVGTDCSNGCIRLKNPEAVEIMDWVRTDKGQGQATRVVVR